jgi:hypothetical protein
MAAIEGAGFPPIFQVPVVCKYSNREYCAFQVNAPMFKQPDDSE